MSAIPASFKLNESQPALSTGMESRFLKIRSDGTTHGPGDICRISIPTSQTGFLNGKESYITLNFKPTFTLGAGSLGCFLDTSVYSLIQRVSIYHGSTLLYNLNNAGLWYNALFDFSSPEQPLDSIAMGCHETYPMAGGRQLTNNATYTLGLCLPAPLVGSLTDKVCPLSWMGSSDLIIEIQWVSSLAKCCTTVSPETGAPGETAASSFNNFLIDQVFYHGKVTRISPDIDMFLKQSLGPITKIQSTSLQSEYKVMAGGSSQFSDRFAMQMSSLRAVFFFLTNSTIENGGVVTHAYPQSQKRHCAKLKEWYLSLDGQDFPASHILTGGIVGNEVQLAETYCALQRALNTVYQSIRPGRVNRIQYADSRSAVANAYSVNHRFLGGIDTERAGIDSMERYQGINTLNSVVQLNLIMSEALVNEVHNVHVLGMFDIEFVLENGVLMRVQ